MLTSGTFETWNEVTWKLLDDGKCYFKGTAYFKDINKTDFFIGSIKSNLKILYNTGRKPILELRYLPDDTAAGNQRMGSLPPSLFSTLSVNLVVSLPADIKETENFELLDRQTAMFVLVGPDLAKAAAKGRLSEYFRDKGAIKLVLASAGKDLFDYQSQVQYAQKEFEKILKSIQITRTDQNIDDKSPVEKSSLKNDFNSRMRRGLAAESRNDFNDALVIYENIINDPNADEKYKAAASYQIGVCFLQMGDREKAESQFEYVITNYPLQGAAAPKSVKMLQNMRAGKIAEKIQERKEIPFVVDTVPGLYVEDVDPNTRSITIIFSEPMKKTDWFYSSFSPLPLPKPAGKPSFDPCGCEWTLPVKLEPGKVYAIAVNPHHQYIGVGVNYGSDEEKVKNVQAGFHSISGQKCENFVLVFATASAKSETSPNGGDEEQSLTRIDEKIVEKCETINFKP
jgi:tetratricopeptide (TPR) repeat protein